MTKEFEKMTYEQKENRLEEILTKLDNAETPVDQLASEAKEAAQLITLMNTTLKAAKQELTTVFEELEKQKENIKKNDE